MTEYSLDQEIAEMHERRKAATRKGEGMSKPFIVLAEPRSCSSWLTVWLNTIPGVVAVHDRTAMTTVKDLEVWSRSKNEHFAGVVDTGLALEWDSMLAAWPDAPIMTLCRSGGDSVAALRSRWPDLDDSLDVEAYYGDVTYGMKQACRHAKNRPLFLTDGHLMGMQDPAVILDHLCPGLPQRGLTSMFLLMKEFKIEPHDRHYQRANPAYREWLQKRFPPKAKETHDAPRVSDARAD